MTGGGVYTSSQKLKVTHLSAVFTLYLGNATVMIRNFSNKNNNR
jgi:hypothetical protein